MAFIPQISEQEAIDATAQAYAEVRKAYGKVPNFYQAQGARPDLISAELALFRFAHKLTRQPDEIAASDVAELRRHGWNDAQIHEAVLATAWFNFVNRISSGLGLIPDF